MDENERGRRPTVEVESVASDIGIATLRGEHDLATQGGAERCARARE